MKQMKYLFFLRIPNIANIEGRFRSIVKKYFTNQQPESQDQKHLIYM